MQRIDHIVPFTKGKRVLDIGGIDHHIEHAETSLWLHKHIADSAQYVLGVDYLKEDVEKAKRLGFNFIHANAERLYEYVHETFEVCVAGELIEHLANPGLFLKSVHRVLEPGGVLIITTPNAFAFGNIYRIVRYALRLPVRPDNAEHKAWYDLFTLRQLLESAGFTVEEMRTIRPERESSTVQRIKTLLYGNAQSKLFCVARKVA